MSSIRKIMGEETYSLIYEHYDNEGNLIDDFEDILYCEKEYISKEKISKLKKLLKPISNSEGALVPLEAAKLLAAWGVSDAIDYFEYCIDNRIDKLGNLSPHRSKGYDTTYEEIERSLLHFYARNVDRSQSDGNLANSRIEPILKKIIALSKEIPYDLTGLIKEIKEENWRNYEPDLKECFIKFNSSQENKEKNHWNIHDLKNLLVEWDPEFINNAKS